MSRKRGIQLSILFGCLLALVSAALWGRGAAAEEDDADELLQPSANWSEALRVSTTSDNGAFVPVIRASSTGRLMIMYNHETVDRGPENPYYTESNDGGDTWSPPDSVHTSDTDSNLIAFDFLDDTAHAIWRTRTYIEEPPYVVDKIFYARENQWADNGSTMIVDAGERIRNLDLATGPGDVIFIVWAQQDGKMYYSLSRNGGGTWSSPTVLTTGQNTADAPSVAIDQNGDTHVVWEERVFDGETFLYEIRYRKGNVTPETVDWDSILNLSSSVLDPEQPSDPRQPTIAVDGNDLHVAFSRRLESDEQFPYYLGYSATNGWDTQATNISPDDPVDVNTNTPFYLISSLDDCGSAVQLYYHGAIDPNPREQVLGASLKGSWSSRVAVTNPDERAINPSMVCTGATVHLVYSLIVNVNDNHQIYYARRTPTVYMPVVETP